MPDSDRDRVGGAMASPEPKPRTYRLVEFDSGTCPECGRIDHRYLDTKATARIESRGRATSIT